MHLTQFIGTFQLAQKPGTSVAMLLSVDAGTTYRQQMQFNLPPQYE
jgi:hypothetical protein